MQRKLMRLRTSQTTCHHENLLHPYFIKVECSEPPVGPDKRLAGLRLVSLFSPGPTCLVGLSPLGRRVGPSWVVAGPNRSVAL